MKNDELLNLYQAGETNYTQMVNDSLGQLFNQTFNITSESSTARDVNKRVKKADYPCLGIQFQAVGNSATT